MTLVHDNSPQSMLSMYTISICDVNRGMLGKARVMVGWPVHTRHQPIMAGQFVLSVLVHAPEAKSARYINATTPQPPSCPVGKEPVSFACDLSLPTRTSPLLIAVSGTDIAQNALFSEDRRLAGPAR